MAFYAELCRRHWYYFNEQNQIHLYRKYLYDTWYVGLTEEQKQKVAEIKRKEKEKADYEFNTLMMMLSTVSTITKRLNTPYY